MRSANMELSENKTLMRKGDVMTKDRVWEECVRSLRWPNRRQNNVEVQHKTVNLIPLG
jgi:hypothetical protein